MEKVKSFSEYVSESIESNTKEAELLKTKEELLAKKSQTQDEAEKTRIERSIAQLDVQIEQIRQVEKEEEAKNEQ